MQTPKQKRACERNWMKAQVMSAQAVCKRLGVIGRSVEERAQAKIASDYLDAVLKDWNEEKHL